MVDVSLKEHANNATAEARQEREEGRKEILANESQELVVADGRSYSGKVRGKAEGKAAMGSDRCTNIVNLEGVRDTISKRVRRRSRDVRVRDSGRPIGGHAGAVPSSTLPKRAGCV